MNEYNNFEQVNRISKSDFLTNVFTYLGIGLGLNALGAMVGYYFLPALGNAYPVVMMILVIVELGCAFMMGRNLEGRSVSAVRMMYTVYSFINGLTLSVIIAVYTTASLLMAFVTATIVFVSLAIIGKTTRFDLSSFGRVFFIGLLVCIIVSTLNLFLFKATGIEIALCYVETLLFMGLIAYDMQMIDRYYSQSDNENYAIFAAFQLELDFINLLLRVLQLFGRRRDD